MVSYYPSILIILICLLTVTLFYLEFDNITSTAQTVFTSSSSSNENNTILTYSTTLKKIPIQTPNPTQSSKPSSKFKSKNPIPKENNIKYGPIPFRGKMECKSYHEKKGIPFKKLWNWPPVQIFIGIWTVADKFEIRNLIRTLNIIQKMNLVGDKVDFKFILGIPPEFTPELESQLFIENNTYGDLIMLNNIENMNHGKSYYYWKWVAEYSDMQYDYVIKTDDDAFVHFQNLALNLRPLPRKNLYYGLENRDIFMYGELETLSVDQVHMIATSSFNQTEWYGHEDRMLGSWLLNHVNSTLIRISENCLIFNDPRTKNRFSRKPWASPNSIVIHRIKEIPAWKSVIDLYIPKIISSKFFSEF
ncbi:hypothetical protein RhiirA5_483530 [Rhizophagus irregularis]|uniref:Hexosyltransferase n=1 Tax=Rhizophagus irregularis TaxID=588596 RepID=A0A2I1E6X9_9GLOM|nr:hypothetical protein RhiirA5_483530 [Rhizophagus irregularis]PKY17885.1 hypothetical protein RhiirB3_489386 [Rhizophagus irregularis]CAB5125120.1 unnamed protein product [Rhizophagus irregularis]CAB5381597.1 unnamed protein product [Rhizophagus irregularis]